LSKERRVLRELLAFLNALEVVILFFMDSEILYDEDLGYLKSKLKELSTCKKEGCIDNLNDLIDFIRRLRGFLFGEEREIAEEDLFKAEKLLNKLRKLENMEHIEKTIQSFAIALFSEIEDADDAKQCS